MKLSKTKMNTFEDFSKSNVYGKKDGNINKKYINDVKTVNGETCDEVEDYTYTIVSTNENYVFKVSLYSRT